MIRVEIKPRQDELYDMYVGDEGDHFVNSSQGYARAEDCVAIARRLWPPVGFKSENITYAPEAALAGTVTIPPEHVYAVIKALENDAEAVVMRVTYRDGRTHTERLR